MSRGTTKTCASCKQDKPTTEFYIDRGKRDFLHSYCKSCTNERATNWRRAHPERSAEQRRVASERWRTGPGRDKARSYAAARARALNALKEKYLDEYKALFAQERAKFEG